MCLAAPLLVPSQPAPGVGLCSAHRTGPFRNPASGEQGRPGPMRPASRRAAQGSSSGRRGTFTRMSYTLSRVVPERLPPCDGNFAVQPCVRPRTEMESLVNNSPPHGLPCALLTVGRAKGVGAGATGGGAGGGGAAGALGSVPGGPSTVRSLMSSPETCQRQRNARDTRPYMVVRTRAWAGSPPIARCGRRVHTHTCCLVPHHRTQSHLQVRVRICVRPYVVGCGRPCSSERARACGLSPLKIM